MKTTILSILSVIISLYAAGQANPQGQVIMYTGNGSMVIMDVPEKEPSVEGTYYLNESWNPGIINLYEGGEIRHYPFKLDLKNSNIEINVGSEVKILPGDKVKGFEWRNQGMRETFLNGSEFEGNEKRGFYKVISLGKITLLKHYNLEIITANYNVAMNVGRESHTYNKEETYYIHSGNTFKKIRTNRRSMLQYFDEKADDVKQFARKNGLRFNDEGDLAKIFDYYNSI